MLTFLTVFALSMAIWFVILDFLRCGDPRREFYSQGFIWLLTLFVLFMTIAIAATLAVSLAAV